jgi:hypothetical protein
MKKTAKRKAAGRAAKPAYSLVMQFEETGQLTVPQCLQLGSDGRLYLAHAVMADAGRQKPHCITLKESVAWFRLGHEYNLPIKKGDAFNQWLTMLERALG